MDSEIKFTLLMTPVAKGRPKFARIGKFVTAYTPSKTKRAEAEIRLLAAPYKPVQPFSKWVHLKVRFYMPIVSGMRKADRILAVKEELYHVKKPDCDNLIKSVTDALNAVFYTDDSIICKLEAVKLYSALPRIVVEMQGE